MATFLIGKAGRKLFEKHMEQYAPADPVYETYVNDSGKEKRRRRALPPGLSKRDRKILQSVQSRAHRLDTGFNICGLKFGWMFIIGVIPIAGDAAAATLNYTLVVRKAKQAEIPDWLFRRMMLNMTVAGGFGLVPAVGDVIAATIRPNSRNAALLEEYLRLRGEEYLKAGDLETIEAAAATAGAGADGKKGKKKVKGMSVKDAEELKPGAGLKEGEVIKGPADPKRGFWGFGGNGKKKAPAPAPAGESRFVEGVPNSQV